MRVTLIGLRRMKGYARSKGGAHRVIMSEKMIEGTKEAKRLNDERMMEEQKKKDLLDARKKAEIDENGRREEILKVTTSTRCLEE